MTTNDTDGHESLKRELARNRELLEENNLLLRKIRKYDLWSFWLRMVWFAALIGLPFALYFYILEPYFSALGSNYATFEAGVQEIPGFKQFNTFLQEYNNKNN